MKFGGEEGRYNKSRRCMTSQSAYESETTRGFTASNREQRTSAVYSRPRCARTFFDVAARFTSESDRTRIERVPFVTSRRHHPNCNSENSPFVCAFARYARAAPIMLSIGGKKKRKEDKTDDKDLQRLSAGSKCVKK